MFETCWECGGALSVAILEESRHKAWRRGTSMTLCEHLPPSVPGRCSPASQDSPAALERARVAFLSRATKGAVTKAMGHRSASKGGNLSHVPPGGTRDWETRTPGQSLHLRRVAAPVFLGTAPHHSFLSLSAQQSCLSEPGWLVPRSAGLAQVPPRDWGVRMGPACTVTNTPAT